MDTSGALCFAACVYGYVRAFVSDTFIHTQTHSYISGERHTHTHTYISGGRHTRMHTYQEEYLHTSTETFIHIRRKTS